MRKIYFFVVATAIFLIVSSLASAQQNKVFDFEELTLETNSYWNGSDESNSFGDDFITFENNYNTTYSSWDCFAYSNMTDQTTQDWTNMYSVYAGEANSGNNFGLFFPPMGGYEDGNTYVSESGKCYFTNPVEISSIWITNSTLGALSIINGDAYSDAFTVDEDDFFKLIIVGKNGETQTGEIEFMLADYTGETGIVIDTWQEVDLSSLGTVDTLLFSLVSTNYGDYGINNPTYFCLDDVTYTTTGAINNEIADSDFSIYPNPTTDYIQINAEIKNVEIYDLTGRIVKISNQSRIDVSDLTSGTYILRAKSENNIKTSKFVKL